MGLALQKILQEPVEVYEPFSDPKAWYESLSLPQKRRLFKAALVKFPNLADMMKMHGIRASSPEFTKHFTFKLFMEILNT